MYSSSITRAIPQITRIRQGIPPGGAFFFVLPLAGLSFAILLDRSIPAGDATWQNRLMDRRTWLLFFFPVLLTACGKPAVTRDRLFPAAIGEWKLSGSSEAPPGETGGEGAPQGALRAWDASYTGPGLIQLRVYEMNSPAGGLDATQRWKHAPDTAVFHHEQYFAVVRWEPMDRDELAKFIRAFETHVKEIA
jgi:hypothetical protein